MIMGIKVRCRKELHSIPSGLEVRREMDAKEVSLSDLHQGLVAGGTMNEITVDLPKYTEVIPQKIDRSKKVLTEAPLRSEGVNPKFMEDLWGWKGQRARRLWPQMEMGRGSRRAPWMPLGCWRKELRSCKTR